MIMSPVFLNAIVCFNTCEEVVVICESLGSLLLRTELNFYQMT